MNEKDEWKAANEIIIHAFHTKLCVLGSLNTDNVLYI